MARKPKTTSKISFVRRAYTTKGVTVTVEIDFEKKTISLVDKNGEPWKNSPQEYAPKRWLFAEREVGYMEGWRLILDAMNVAIDEAEKELREYLDTDLEERAKALAEMNEALSDDGH